MYSVTSASITHTGKVREINEDAVLEKGNLFAVADGMGGHQAGEVASALALSVIEQYVEDNIGTISGEKLVENAMSAANSSVFGKATSSARFRDMGTTLTLIYREGNIAYIGHVGDSRACLLRNGEMRQLTRDHSLVAKLVEDGEITPEEARAHPQRNIITKALGLEPRVTADVVSVEIQPGDVFMLETDGLSSLVEDGDIQKVLVAEPEPTAAARRLVDLALEAGGIDNVSVVLVSFRESTTTVPVAGARQAAQAEGGAPAGKDTAPTRRRRSRAILIWLIVIGALVVLLAAGFGVGYYIYNRTFYVGARDGKVTLFKGFPFWGISNVEKKTDLEVGFLPEALRERVIGKLEPESRQEADKTLKSLKREVVKNSSLVPDVEGKKFEEAKELIEKAGLRAEVELVSRPAPAPDVVLVQDPQPGSRVGKGTSVKLKVVMGGTPAREV